MSQRKALIASVVITLVLALSAVGIRAAFFNSPDASADPQSGVTLVVPGTGSYDDDGDDRYEDSDDEDYTSNTYDHDDEDDDDSEDSDHEEDHDDDEH